MGGRVEEFWHVIEGLENDFDQGIPEVPIKGMKYYCPANHSSVMEAKENIEKNLREEIEAERIYGPFSKEEAWAS